MNDDFKLKLIQLGRKITGFLIFMGAVLTVFVNYVVTSSYFPDSISEPTFWLLNIAILVVGGLAAYYFISWRDDSLKIGIYLLLGVYSAITSYTIFCYFTC